MAPIAAPFPDIKERGQQDAVLGFACAIAHLPTHLCEVTDEYPSCGSSQKGSVLVATMTTVGESSVWEWLTPTLVFVGAMITLYVTNRRADRREWNKWRRDTLLKLCADAVDASYEAEAAYESRTTMDEEDFVKVRFDTASKAIARITGVAEQLNLVGAHHLAQTCRDMKAALEEIRHPAWALRVARNTEKRAHARATKAMEKEHPEWFGQEDDPPDDDYVIGRARAIVEFHKAWIADPLANFNEAAAGLDAVRARFIKRGQAELKTAN